MTRVLFIIPVLSRSRSEEILLKRCLESLRRFEPGMLAHTILVEEFASLGAQDMAKEFGCQYFQKHTEPGYSASINIGIEHAKQNSYTHVVTVNSDIEFTHSILPAFMRAFRYGDIVGGTLFYPSGKVQSASWHYLENGIPKEDEKGILFNSAQLYRKERYVGGITGALQGFSLECGKYDEGFSLSYEDVWFCISNLQAGKKIFYTPTISAIHFESATRGRFLGERELASYKYFERLTDKVDFKALNSKIGEYNEGYEQRMGQTKTGDLSESSRASTEGC